MPLTEKGKEIMAAMKEQYGERGEQVFYASRNAGKITGVDNMAKSKDVSDPRLESINDEGDEGVNFSIGDEDDPDKVETMEDSKDETEDVPSSMYSRGNRRQSAISDKGVGKKPSFLTSDSGKTLRNMNQMNRRFWGNGRGRGRGR